ncbi:TetR/AcrR family transcriptional regulator [Gordonia sp. DT30]|uniref:TetR/AcrR family transcriptional regulator n=1 Tax=Gordonia sp. DT30 TaxID=3416546 RepID=UPI003CFB6963
MPEQPPRRKSAPTRRRSETRERLLDAAFEAFVAKGFGRTTIDDVCRAAGYTKGAFYSNFGSLEQLFFALYDRQSAYGAEFTTDMIGSETTAVEELIVAWAEQVLLDRDWLLINTDFVSYAARFREVAGELADHRRELRTAVTDVVAAFIEVQNMPLPPSLSTPAELARAIVTVYDGVIYQLLLDMDEATVRRHFVAIMTALIRPEQTRTGDTGGRS